MVTNWPCAYPVLGVSATFKQSPEDFRVDETLDFEPAGSGEHLFLYVEKRELATPEVAERFARRFGVGSVAVGYAGMKDKMAVTRQWFSVHTAEDGVPTDTPGCNILSVTRHDRKLRRGQIAGNAFTILLKNLRGDGWAERLALWGEKGVPNYFGPQRFGTDNLHAARMWLERRRQRRVSKFKQGLYLSVLRSYLFNEVLAMRVAGGTWDQLLEGDVLIDHRPSGPLWGRGRSQSAAASLAVETEALTAHRVLCDGLEQAGVRQQRRALVLKPHGLRWEAGGDELLMRFELPAGSYATSLLSEGFDLV